MPGHMHVLYRKKKEPRPHLPNQHLIEQHAQSPPVHRSRVRCVCQHFGRQELWGSTECAGPVSIAHPWVGWKARPCEPPVAGGVVEHETHQTVSPTPNQYRVTQGGGAEALRVSMCLQAKPREKKMSPDHYVRPYQKVAHPLFLSSQDCSPSPSLQRPKSAILT